jgi:uncharacterized protein YjdB
VGRLEVQPGIINLTVGASASLRADVFDTKGGTLAGRRVFWSSQNSAIATVSQTGTLTAVAPGVATVAANSGGKSGLANVTVTARPVSVVRVTPTSNQVTVGNSVTLLAEALDAGGIVVLGKAFLWTSSSSTIVTVSSTGVVTALAPGNATISASVDGIAGSATVTAAPVPIASISITPPTGTVTVAQNLQLHATPLDALGNVLNGRSITWGSSDNAIATVSSTGLVVGLAAGRSTITASSEGESATAAITVTLVPIDNISLAPSQATIAAGTTVQLSPTAKDANGNLLGGRPFTWTSDQPTIATVSASGVVTGVAQGVARVTVEAEGKTAVALVTVTPIAIASIDVAPATANLAINATVQLTATPKDAQGQPLPGRIITWITGAPSVATVTQSGRVTAVGNGSAIIFAASEGVSGSASITVSSISVATVVVTPSTSNIIAGGFVQLSAATLDGQGNALAGRTVTWSSSNQTIAVVSSTGRVQSVSAGTVTITATSEGVTGTASVTMSNVPIASIVVTPSSATMVIGQATTLVATPRDAQGNQLLGRTIAWASSNVAVATVNANGDVTAIGPGTAQISATSELIQGFAAITVTSIPVASVNMTPVSASLSVPQTQLMTVTVRDALSLPLSGRTVTFTSSDVTAGTVSPATTSSNALGQAFATVTAVGSGATTITATSGSVQATSTISVTQVPIATITVTPPTPAVEEGQAVQLTATAKDAGGVTLLGRTIVWSSNNPIISVSQTGLVTAIANTASQAVTITASSPGGGAGGTTPSGAVTFTVSFAPVAFVSVLPSPASVTVGGTTALTLTLKDALGISLNSAGRTITWTSLNLPLVTVHPITGVLTGVANGPAMVRVTARSPGQLTLITQDVPVTVTNPVVSVTVTPGPTGIVHVGSAYQRTFTAVAKDFGGSVLPGRPFVWSSTNSAVASAASVDPFTAVVTGVSQGAATITATTEGISGPSGVTVDLVSVDSVAMSQTMATLIPPDTMTLLATPKDSAGNDIAGAALGGRGTSWNSLNSGATVGPAGLVTAVGIVAASGPITAKIGGTTGTTALTVLAPVASVVLAQFTPDSVIAPNAVPGVATVSDAAAIPLSNRPVTLLSNSPRAVVTPTSGTTSGAGTVAFTVTGVAGLSGPVTVSVTALSELHTSPGEPLKIRNPVNAITLTAPVNSLIGIGGTVPATTTLKDAFNNTITTADRVVTYTYGPAVVSVSATGVITAVGFGNTTIIANCEGKADSLAFSVLAPVATVTLTALGDSVVAGSITLQSVVVLKDAGGNTLTGRPITYGFLPATLLATVSASGLISGSGSVVPLPGASVSLIATSEGVTAATPLVVRVLAPVNTITVTAPDLSIDVGSSVTATALLKDVNSNTLTGRTVNWTSSNNPIATVGSTTGIITAITPGQVTVTATAEGKNGLILLFRSLGPVDTVKVTPFPVTISNSSTTTLTVTVTDVAINPLDGISCSISSLDTGIANPTTTMGATDSSGIVTFIVSGVSIGATTVTVTCNSKSNTFTVTVQ